LAKPESTLSKEATERVEAQARSWVVYLHSGDATSDKVAEFETWLAQSDAHARAYRDFEQILVDVALPCGVLDMDAPDKPDGVPSPAVSAKAKPAFRPVRGIAAGLIAAALVLTASIAVSQRGIGTPTDDLQYVEQPVIETQIAEIRDVTLPDGTVVTLGAKSRIDYRFEDGLRKVILKEGEAFFDVAPDKSHPFYVQAGDRLVRVVGTRFDVRQSSESVIVSVVEGVVEVIKANDPEVTEKRHNSLDKDVLTAGDKVTATIGEDHRQIEEVDPEKAAAWRNGWLVYENVSLSDIVTDIHRYDARTFLFERDDLKDLHITAAFGSDKIDQFLDAVAASYPLLVDQDDPSMVIFRPAT
jgi:transmembrane sensor